MPDNYTRCSNPQCDHWVLWTEGMTVGSVFCPTCLKADKPSIIAIINEQVLAGSASTMTMGELEQWILDAEAEVERARAVVQGRRAYKSQRLEALTDAEISELRRNPYKVKKEPETKESKQAKKVASIKSDPVGYLMQQYPTMTRDVALKFAKDNGLVPANAI